MRVTPGFLSSRCTTAQSGVGRPAGGLSGLSSGASGSTPVVNRRASRARSLRGSIAAKLSRPAAMARWQQSRTVVRGLRHAAPIAVWLKPNAKRRRKTSLTRLISDLSRAIPSSRPNPWPSRMGCGVPSVVQRGRTKPAPLPSAGQMAPKRPTRSRSCVGSRPLSSTASCGRRRTKRFLSAAHRIMKAFIVDRYGSNHQLRFGDMPEPQLRDDVLVQIHAAGVNPLDSKIRNGEFKLILPYRLPLILGNDVAGIVVRVGRNVRRFKPGDEVYARPDKDRIGTFAEYIAMNEADVALKPRNLSME